MSNRAARICAGGEWVIASNLDLLREIYPARITLTTREVALALYGRQDRSAVQAVREMLVQGRLVPFLTKPRGRWLIPVAALAMVLDDLQVVALRPLLALPMARTGRRTNIGPRFGIDRY